MSLPVIPHRDKYDEIFEAALLEDFGRLLTGIYTLPSECVEVLLTAVQKIDGELQDMLEEEHVFRSAAVPESSEQA